MKTKINIILTPAQSEELFYNSLCNAEGAGYMRSYGLELAYDEKEYEAAKKKLKSPCYEDVLMQMLRDGYKLTYEDIEGEGDMTRSITLKDVHDKVKNTPLQHLTDAVEENDDAETADVILQTVFFDEIVFG